MRLQEWKCLSFLQFLCVCAGCGMFMPSDALCWMCWQTLQNTEESFNELLHKAIEKFVHPQSPTNYVNLLHLLLYMLFGLLCWLNCWSFFWFPPSNLSGTICLMYDAPGKFLLSFASDRSSGNQYETYSPSGSYVLACRRMFTHGHRQLIEVSLVLLWL